MMHTEISDIDKADDAEVAVEEELSEELFEEIPEETVVMPETVNSDNVGDVSVEINVEELVAELESSNGDDANKKEEIRKRLDEIREQRLTDQETGGTYNIDLDEDI